MSDPAESKVVIVVLSKYMEVFQGLLDSSDKYELEYLKILVQDMSIDPLARWDLINRGWHVIPGSKVFSMAGNANLGIREASMLRPDCDILYCGDDVRFVQADTVEKLCKIASSNPQIGILSPRIVGRGSPSQVHPTSSLTFPRALEMWFPCVYIKRSLIDRIGLLDEQFSGFGSDDLDYCIRAQMAGFKLAITAEVAVEHESSPEGGPSTFVKSIGIDEWQRQQSRSLEKLRLKYGVTPEALTRFLNTGEIGWMRPVGIGNEIKPNVTSGPLYMPPDYGVGRDRDDYQPMSPSSPPPISPVAATANLPPSAASASTVPVIKHGPKPGLRGKSLCLLTPMYGGQCTMNFITAFGQLIPLCMRLGVNFTWVFINNESLIPRARNRLVDRYLKTTDSTHAVFIDADIGFRPQDILGMLELDLDIVGAGCTKKSLRWDRMQKAIRRNGRQFTPDEMMLMGGDFVINFDIPHGQRKEFNLGELQPMSRLGTGCLMIKRQVFERFQEQYSDRWYQTPEDSESLPGKIFDYFRTGINPENRKYESEDYWFCIDCRAIGYDIMLCPWVVTDHMGAFTYKADMGAVSQLVGEL